jgi:hypothetical protein
MTRSTMRRGVREALADVELYLPFPWSIEELTERLGTQRAKPIRLVAWAFPAEPDAPTGLWVATDQADYVFYDSDASPARREQIIGHELGHLLLGHTPRLSEAFDGLIEALAPSVSRELARQVLAMARTGYAEADEAAAELFGTSLIRAAHTKRRPADGGELGRLTEALR